MSSQSYADYEPEKFPLSEPAVKVQVQRYVDGTYEELPNIQVIEIQERGGLEPHGARFEYVTDERAIAQGWPSEFEEIYALAYQVKSGGGANANRKNKAKSNGYVVQPDDRLVVFVTDQSGVTDLIFDGFAEAPQVNIDPGGQTITFVAVSVSFRLYEKPIAGRREAWMGLEDGFAPTEDKYQRLVDLPTRFNDDGKPNCTPKELWFKGPGSLTYPIFWQDSPGAEGTAHPVPWTLALAARYLIGEHLGYHNDYVESPDLDVMDRLLNRRRPKEQKEDEPPDPNLFYDPEDSATYEESDIVLRDFDASGMRWPEALYRMLEFSGFGARFMTEGDEDAQPTTMIEIYRKDNGGPTDPKTLHMQPRRSDLDTAKTQVASFGVVRDYKNCFNAVIMDSYPVQVEVSVILAMRGPTTATDKDNTKQFTNAAISDPTSPAAVKYRWWIADELGFGHVAKDGSNSETPFDFAPAFKGFDEKEPLRKYRPGDKHLVTVDSKKAQRVSQLWMSRDYAGDTAKIWDGTGTWQLIPAGWSLMKDQLGVILTHDDLEKWTIGTPAGDQSKGPVVQLISAMCAPTDKNKRIFLRLDTTIEADTSGFEEFESRKSSILKWPRYRYLNGKGTFRRKFIHASSPNFEAADGDAKDNLREFGDGLKEGISWMTQTQLAGENPSVAGPITIPWFTRAYDISDRIAGIDGRDLSLQVNQGSSQGEAKAFPFIEGRTHRFKTHEETVITLEDHRALPDSPNSKRK